MCLDCLNSGGLFRKIILSEIDYSLKCLEMDYVDLYIIYCFDENMLIEEIMEVLYDVVKFGKVCYIGVSVMYVW